MIILHSRIWEENVNTGNYLEQELPSKKKETRKQENGKKNKCTSCKDNYKVII